jgi:hypothetical protein
VPRPAPIHATERPAVAFVVALVALVVGTVAAWELLPGLRDRVDAVAAAQGPDHVDFYLANGRGGHVDHHVLFFGLDDTAIAHLRAADVLFLGNSRLMFAMDPAVFGPFFEARGLKPYVMGFGFREADAFPLAVMRRLDLRPRLVVVNADGFFGGGLSDWAEEVVRDTPFEARKWQWESESAHGAARVIHQLVPNWLELLGRPGFPDRTGFIAHRSRTDGSWLVSSAREGPRETILPSDLAVPEPGRHEFSGARRFKAELDARGARLVLMLVPTPERMGGSPVRLAETLGVPFVDAGVAGLSSKDNSHLDAESAPHFTRALLEALAPHLPPPAAPPTQAGR